MHTDEIGDILGRLDIFHSMYEMIRLVDPVLKKVINYSNNTVTELDSQCYDFWGKKKTCDNCISIRAYKENKSFVKLEYTGERIYVITAIPYEISDRRVVIEVLKDATNSLVFEIGPDGSGSEIHTMIDRMNALAMKDPLTGIYNRRYIEEKLPIDLVNATLSDKRLSLIMADIDFFKKVNDTYGHLAGDYVLKNFAETLAMGLQRESDWVGRFGGEEFLVGLPGAGPERAAAIAEAMRKAVENKEIRYGENLIRITASFGVCTLKPGKDDSVESLIKGADDKLYLAKSNGRNRVEC